MLKKRNAQGISITTIIVAIIALIVLVIIIAIFGTRMGLWGTDLNQARNCNQVCTSLGYATATTVNSDECGDATDHVEMKIPGTFSDVTGTCGASECVCCCYGS